MIKRIFGIIGYVVAVTALTYQWHWVGLLSGLGLVALIEISAAADMY